MSSDEILERGKKVFFISSDGKIRVLSGEAFPFGERKEKELGEKVVILLGSEEIARVERRVMVVRRSGPCRKTAHPRLHEW